MQPLLDDRHQDVDRDRDPHLRLHGVLVSSEERLDPQVLLVSGNMLFEVLGNTKIYDPA
jgi:hypothetical protein